jgi:hypothetical protein
MKIRRLLGHLVWTSTLLLAGCAPLSVPAPYHFAETAKTLERGQARVTAAAGGGAGVPFDGSGGGGALRMRVGVGAHQEVGVEGELLKVDTGSRQEADPRWIGTSLAFGYKLSWKISPRDWFAVMAGAGGAHSVLGESLGGDVGVLFARPVGVFRPYGGLRVIFAAPVGRPIDDRGGITAGLSVAGGLSFHVSPRIDLFFEGGLAVLTSTGSDEDPTARSINTSTTSATNMTSMTSMTNNDNHTVTHLGPYGLFALSITLGRVAQ